MITKYALFLTFLFFITSSGVVAGEDNVVCIKELTKAENECLSREKLTELRQQVKLLFKDQRFAEVYDLLKVLDIDEDAHLLSSRAAVYFFQSKPHSTLCETVRDLEKAIGDNEGQAVVTISYLNALYYGNWRNVAALEGNVYARMELVAARLHLSQKDHDTMRKLNPKLFFERLLSLLVLKNEPKTDDKLTQRLQNLRNEIFELAELDGLKPEELKSQYIEPREVICKPR